MHAPMSAYAEYPLHICQSISEVLVIDFQEIFLWTPKNSTKISYLKFNVLILIEDKRNLKFQILLKLKPFFSKKAKGITWLYAYHKNLQICLSVFLFEWFCFLLSGHSKTPKYPLKCPLKCPTKCPLSLSGL